jgi:hypothetical protein
MNKSGSAQCVKYQSILRYSATKTGISHLSHNSCKFAASQSNNEEYLHPSSSCIPQRVKLNVTPACLNMINRHENCYNTTGSGFVNYCQSLIKTGLFHGD